MVKVIIKTITKVKVTDNINKGQGQSHNIGLVPNLTARSECVATVTCGARDFPKVSRDLGYSPRS